MTEEDREKLDEELKALDAAAEPLLKARRPLDDALAAIDGVRAATLERYGIEDIAGRCETCDGILLPGDLHHGAADGVLLCEGCAPTWCDILREYEGMAPDDFDDPHDHAIGVEAANAHIAAGRGDAKHVWPLP